jgi:hypothetical protein
VTSFEFLNDKLLLITSSPASLQVLHIFNQTVKSFGSLQGANFAPLQVYTNQESYGTAIFVDNTINLLMLQLVPPNVLNNTNTNGPFQIIAQIPYAYTQAGQSVAVGLTQDGVYIAYSYPAA